MTGTVWVTGGNGMVGRGVIGALRRAHPGLAITAPSSSHLDLTDAKAVENFVEAARPNVVIHAAGRVGGIAANVARPVEFLVDNMRIGLNVVTASQRAGVPALLNVSSSCMYPRGHDGLLVEEMVLTGELEPTNEGYAIAKIATDKLCEYVSRGTGLAYRTLIPSNLYGPGDHFDDHRGHLIANAMRKVHDAARSGAGSVEIWGDGTAKREFTYVGDVADYIARKATVLEIEQLPQRMNIGIGADSTVKEFYELIADVVGFDGQFSYDRSKPPGMARKLMDSSLARTHGWSPGTPLEVGLRATYRHYLEAIGETYG